MRLAFAPYTLKFRSPAGTSRGVLTEKLTWFIKIWDETGDPSKFGIGEAALFQGLSSEDTPAYQYKLIELLANVALGRDTDLSGFSSIKFGLEQAIMDFSNGCKGIYYPSDFTAGTSEIEINGLVWMGSFDEMEERLKEKIAQGFRCIKLKIGAIDWKKEVELIEYIRRNHSPEELTIRVDANGAFDMEQALPRLKRLADLGVHSIEQPIRAGYPELMAFLCKVSPCPIALDEELIGINSEEARKQLISFIKPQYIVLKPALCGGFSGASEWIDAANENGVGWWITSALESNVGLDAIAQWTAGIGAQGVQGLGTGALFTNNFPSPLRLDGDRLRYDASAPIDRSVFDQLPWRV